MVISSLKPGYLSQLLRHTPAPLTLAELLQKLRKQRCLKAKPARLVLAESWGGRDVKIEAFEMEIRCTKLRPEWHLSRKGK